MVYEQITMLETLCTNIELAAGALANKRMVKMNTQMNDFVAKRLKKGKKGGQGVPDSESLDDINTLRRTGSGGVDKKVRSCIMSRLDE
jgi:hypothetical protein